MKQLAFSFLALLALVACSQSSDTMGIIQYLPFQESENSGWGLISTDGEVLVGDDYQHMPTVVMHNRFFAKNKDGKWELYTIDKHPKQIGNSYSQVGVFIAEVAPVVEDGKFIEFINVNGDVMFTLDRVNGKDVTTCTNFSDGVAVFRAGKYCGAINTKGEVIVDPRYIEILPAKEGKMLALDKKYERNLQQGDLDNINYTIISTTGEELGTISTRRFKIASQAFVSGALVVTDESGNGAIRTGLINEKGDWIVKASEKIKSIKSIRNNTFIFSDGDGYGVMNFDGEVIIRPRYANLIFANDKELLYAKNDKEESGYMLIDMKENKISREEYSNVLPFFRGRAIVQESANNWILIDEEAVDQRIKQDIYRISASAYGDHVLVSEHVDYQSVIGELKLTKDGFLGMTLNMDAEHIVSAINSFETDDAGSADARRFANATTINGRSLVNGINVSISSSFDNPIANDSIFNNVQPNQIGMEIPAEGMIRGKSGAMAREIISRVQAFGQTVKSNQNAAIIQVNDASYFVANSGTGVFVVYGYLDNNLIDIEQYNNIVDKNDAPVRRYEERDLFNNIPEESF